MRVARFQMADARDLPVDDGRFDVVVSGLALNFIRDPLDAMTELVRVVREDGVVAVYVWDYADRMQMLRYFWDAAREIHHAAAELDEGERFPVCRPSALEALFREVGLLDVAVQAIDVPTVFHDFDDFWSPFLGEQGPAPGFVSSLNLEQRSTLEARLRTTLPIGADGSVALFARAWSVRGQKK